MMNKVHGPSRHTLRKLAEKRRDRRSTIAFWLGMGICSVVYGWWWKTSGSRWLLASMENALGIGSSQVIEYRRDRLRPSEQDAEGSVPLGSDVAVCRCPANGARSADER